MTNVQRNLLGAATVASVLITAPVLWLLFFGNLTSSERALDVFSVFVIFHSVLFWIYYRNVFRNPSVPDLRRHAWSIAIFLGLAFAQLIYYWLYVRKPSLHAGSASF